MTCTKLIEELRRHKIVPKLSGTQLKLSGNISKIPPALLQRVREEKIALISFLKGVENEFEQILEIPQQPHYISSNAQRRLWLLNQYRGAGGAYNIVASFLLKGDLSLPVLEKALRLIIGKHESLRTNFREIDGELRQFISSNSDFKIGIENIEIVPKKEEFLFQEINKATEFKFDLSGGTLLNVRVYKMSDIQHAMVLTVHHIISDGWSIGILVNEILHTYQMCMQNHNYCLLPLRIQYKEYTYWLDKKIKNGYGLAASTFWKNQFSDIPDSLNLDTDFPRPDNRSFDGCFLRSPFKPAFHARIINYCSSIGVTPFNFFRTTLTLLLNKLSGQRSITVGVPVSGRNHIELKSQIGLFVNTIPLNTKLAAEDSFSELIIKVSRNSNEALMYQDYPFDLLVEDLRLKYHGSRNPLFDVMMVLHDTASKFEYNNKNASVIELKLLDTFLQNDLKYLHGDRPVKFDLTFNFSDDLDGGFFLEVDYSTALFKRSTIEKIINTYNHLMSMVLDDPSRPIRNIEVIQPHEKKLILESFNNTTCQYPMNKTVISLIEEQVEKTPNNVAIVCGQQELTYRELNQKINQFANYLRLNYSVQADDLICIKLERSEWLIIAILGVLKSGGAYIPIDPEYPEERIKYMIRDSHCKLLIDQNELNKFRNCEKVFECGNVLGINQAEDLFYVIYTSGSTGLPKGSMVKQHSFVNLIQWYKKLLKLDSTDTVLLMASISFDLAQKNIFATLITGAKLCISAELYNDYEILAKTISKNSVTVINAAPSAFYPLLDVRVNSNFACLESLKNVVLGGEPISAKKFLPWVDSYFYNARVVNGYGPTECTSVVSSHIIDNRQWRSLKSIPIGKPIDNVNLYILDETLTLAPIGMIGEIFVSGVCVGRGYLFRTELTEKKFLPDPYRIGSIMYATGDLGRWLPDGNIEFLGRRDTQLKIRGFRIETGEIESVLLTHHDINSAIVVGRMNMNQEAELVAYIECLVPIKVAALREFLKMELPAYMLPAHFVFLKSLPLTPSGKVDRNALPSPAIDERIADTPLVEPLNDLEAKLLIIWQKVLGRQHFGVTDNFFDLGGNSISIMRMVGMVNESFDKKISSVIAFQFPNISSLAKYMTQHVQSPTTDSMHSVNTLEETLNLINKDSDDKG